MIVKKKLHSNLNTGNIRFTSGKDMSGFLEKFHGIKSRIKLKIFIVILVVLTVISGIPIFTLMNQSFSSLDESRKILKETIEINVKEQTTDLYKMQAGSLSERISQFLESCEADLNNFAVLPRQPELYQEFSKSNVKWVHALEQYVPIYKELVLIDASGKEQIKIVNNKVIERDYLKDVNKPENTTYLSETYFNDTRNSTNDIFVSKLVSWYISRKEQLDFKKSFDGVIRFNKKLKTKDGRFAGICSIALDGIHLLDFIGYKNIPREEFVDRYKQGSYNYLVDEDGWIIAHQKLWDIKGLNRDGSPIKPLTKETPDWKFASGIIPINLYNMDWRLKDYETQEPMSSIIERVRRGESVITTMKSMGIHNEVDGIVRTRAYAPIFYSPGGGDNHKVFGIVSVGTSLKDFNDNTEILASKLGEINDSLKERIYYISLLIFGAVLFFSYLIAKWIANPVNKLTAALTGIGKGNYSVDKIKSPIEEINVLSGEVTELAGKLKEKEKEINNYIKDVEFVNHKLAQAKKELSAYWHHEYEAESDTILEEKIKLYEEEYPALKELRKEKCIGISPAFLRVLRLVIPQSQMNIPTWIHGESGVGKSMLGYVVHALSPRADKPYFVFGASEFAAADPLIVLGKLFGYGPGHGINNIDKEGQKGILEECDGGTLLIDDVDSLPLDTQSQLLRVIDGLDFHYAAGKSKSISVDVRFLFASNVDLEKSIKEGKFRKDLYRRIGGSYNKIEIPSLRKRKPDIPLLADYFIKRFSKKHNITYKLKDSALNVLYKHDYREGNIAELKTLIEIACESARIEDDGIISKKHFASIYNREIKTEEENETGMFSKDELQKLTVLRENYFRMDISEETLGFRPGSHTLSHYLRGMSLKALSHTDWQVDSAAKLIVGPELNGKTQELICKKIQGYIKNITSKKDTNQEEVLYRNLPKEYHKFLNSAIKVIS